MNIFKKIFGSASGSKPYVETIKDPKILLCSIKGDDIDAELLVQDRFIYQDHYKSISEYKAADVTDFFNFIHDKPFDIVHLFVKIESDWTIEGQPASQMMKHLAERDVKLIIFARSDSSSSFVKAFQAGETSSIKVNFIVALDRKGEKFGSFFKDLFALIANGETFLVAWVRLAPQQGPDPSMENLPYTLAVPNRGDLKFIPSRSQANGEMPPAQVMQNANQASPGASPTNEDSYKNLLFVDQSLEELVKHYNAPPNDLFHQAYNYVNDSRPEEAKESLKQVLVDPTAEVRTRLWAWKALRQLGEKPSPSIGNEVQGVVLEFPIESSEYKDNWVDTLAAYSDSRARYLNGKTGTGIIWEAPEEPRVNSLVMSVMNAAKPLVEETPIFEKHQSTQKDVIRASVLTYGGIHIIEAQWSDISQNKSHVMARVYDAGTQLFLALLEIDKKRRQRQ